MISNELEQTKKDVLEYAFLYSLPDLENGTDMWIRAIGLVTKSNTKQNYCILSKNGFGEINVIKTFGSAAKIVKINEIRPYVYLNQKYIIEFKNKAEIISYILKQYTEYSEDELKTITNANLKALCINHWINQQLEDCQLPTS